jgi:hypothetical protein
MSSLKPVVSAEKLDTSLLPHDLGPLLERYFREPPETISRYPQVALRVRHGTSKVPR